MFVPESLIFRSDSNGEDLEGYAGAGECPGEGAAAAVKGAAAGAGARVACRGWQGSALLIQLAAGWQLLLGCSWCSAVVAPVYSLLPGEQFWLCVRVRSSSSLATLCCPNSFGTHDPVLSVFSCIPSAPIHPPISLARMHACPSHHPTLAHSPNPSSFPRRPVRVCDHGCHRAAQG